MFRSEVSRSLERVENILVSLTNSINKHFHELEGEIKRMASVIDDLVVDVAAQKTVIDGAVTLIQGFNTALADINKQLADVLAQLAAAGADTAELARVNGLATQLHTDVEAQTAELADAMVVNTPAQPATNQPIPFKATKATPVKADK